VASVALNCKAFVLQLEKRTKNYPIWELTYVDQLSSELNELKNLNADKLSFDHRLQASITQPAVIAAIKVCFSQQWSHQIHCWVLKSIQQFAISQGEEKYYTWIAWINFVYTDAENKADDEIVFKELCEMNFSVKPVLGPMGCRRLRPSGRDINRPLRRLF